MLKPDEQVRLNNFRTQYNSILSNIEIATKELNEVLSNKTNLESEILEMREQINSLRIEQNQIALVLRDSNRRTKEALTKLESANEQEKIFLQETKKLKEVAEELVTLIKLKKNELDILDADKPKLVQEISVLRQEVKEIRNQLDVEKRKLSYIITECNIARSEQEQLEEAHILRKKEMEQEIEALIKKGEEERSKITDAYDFFEQKDAEYKRRERDIDVVTRRLKKLFEEVKPGTALKI